MQPKLLNDMVFHAVFGQEKSKHILICLLNALLQYPKENKIVDIELLNPYHPATFISEKFTVLDLKARDNSSKQYNIEVQLRPDKAFIPRIVYYSTRMFSGQMKEGAGFETLKKTVQISLLENWTLLKDEESLHNEYAFINRRSHNELTDLVELHVIELSKFRKRETRELESEFERWLYVLKYVPEFNAAITEKFTDEEGIQMAIEMYRSVTEDEIFREQMALREKSEHIYITEMNQVKQEGIEIGITEGKKLGIDEGKKLGIDEGKKLGIDEGKKLGIDEGTKRTAKEMKLRGMAIAVIAEVTKLSVDEILAL